MTPERFIAKWRSVELKERSAAQSHFLDLCELLDEPKPTDADPKGEWYCFVVDGAAVRVSLIGFSRDGDAGSPAMLDGQPCSAINPDLTSGAAADLTRAKRLRANAGVAFMATIKAGRFDVDGATARHWLRSPANPSGRRDAEVVWPFVNSLDVLRRGRDAWVIFFGANTSLSDATYFEKPFAHVREHVRPARAQVLKKAYREKWWLFAESCTGMWRAISDKPRFIATPTVAKHRLFVWLEARVCPDHQLIVIARADDAAFGILHSRFHELWSLRLGTWLGVGNDPRYTPSTTFETFPFPEGLTPDVPIDACASDPRAQRIAVAAKRLHELREAWLNPPDLVRRVPEVVPGYPHRLVAKDEAAAKELKKRTLTNLYNQRPAWLDNLHRELDAAVAAAYGWPADLADEEILRRLLELNQERAVTGR